MDKNELLRRFEGMTEEACSKGELKFLIEGAINNLSLEGEERDKAFFALGAGLAAETLADIVQIPAALFQVVVKAEVLPNFENYIFVIRELAKRGAT